MVIFWCTSASSTVPCFAFAFTLKQVNVEFCHNERQTRRCSSLERVLDRRCPIELDRVQSLSSTSFLFDSSQSTRRISSTSTSSSSLFRLLYLKKLFILSKRKEKKID